MTIDDLRSVIGDEPSILSAFVDTIRAAVRSGVDVIGYAEQAQRKMLRKGLIPHSVFLPSMDIPTLQLHAATLHRYLVARDQIAEAGFLLRLGPLIEREEFTFLLRIIFPEIESMFRKRVYEAHETGITSFKEARWIVLKQLECQSVGDAYKSSLKLTCSY